MDEVRRFLIGGLVIWGAIAAELVYQLRKKWRRA